MSGMMCDVTGCIWNDGNGGCGCDGIYISDAENGDPICESASFPGEEERKECETILKGDQWIPADEPPQAGEYVLLSFENFSVPLVGRYDESEEGGAYYVGDDMESCISQDVIVNAWQQLPEPYKAED